MSTETSTGETKSDAKKPSDAERKEAKTQSLLTESKEAPLKVAYAGRIEIEGKTATQLFPVAMTDEELGLRLLAMETTMLKISRIPGRHSVVHCEIKGNRVVVTMDNSLTLDDLLKHVPDMDNARAAVKERGATMLLRLAIRDYTRTGTFCKIRCLVLPDVPVVDCASQM